MGELKDKLSKELLGDLDVEIMSSSVWRLPIHAVEVAYQTVQRTKMDILMKMILIAIEETVVKTEEELSTILLVEQLFINDLISKLVNSGLIIQRENIFNITTTGKEQLTAGIYVHEPENNKKRLLFSPCHQKFLLNEMSNQADEKVMNYRYLKDLSSWSVTSLESDKVINALKKAGVELTTEKIQSVITNILTTEAVQVHWITCIEYHLYNKKEDLYYVRVWNTLTSGWDKLIELQLTEYETKIWREKYARKVE